MPLIKHMSGVTEYVLKFWLNEVVNKCVYIEEDINIINYNEDCRWVDIRTLTMASFLAIPIEALKTWKDKGNNSNLNILIEIEGILNKTFVKCIDKGNLCQVVIKGYWRAERQNELKDSYLRCVYLGCNGIMDLENQDFRKYLIYPLIGKMNNIYSTESTDVITIIADYFKNERDKQSFYEVLKKKYKYDSNSYDFIYGDSGGNYFKDDSDIKNQYREELYKYKSMFNMKRVKEV